MRRPAALARLPKLRIARDQSEPLIPNRDAYPDLADDLATLDGVLVARFHELDAAALRCQNGFLRGQVLLIAGSAVATSVGAVQTALGGGVLALGIGQAVLAGGLTLLAGLIARGRARGEYVDYRLRAERLRAHYFLYLACAPPYAGGDRDDQLRREVAQLGGRRD